MHVPWSRICAGRRKPHEGIEVAFHEFGKLFLHGFELDGTLDMPVQADHEPVPQAIPFAQRDGTGCAILLR